MKKLTNLIALEECDNLIPATTEDKAAIVLALNEEIELTIDEHNRVWNEGGQYVADVASSVDFSQFPDTNVTTANGENLADLPEEPALFQEYMDRQED